MAYFSTGLDRHVLNTVTEVSVDGATLAIPVGHDPSGIAVGEHGVWVVDTQDDAVLQIDPMTGASITTIPVGHGPAAVAVGESSACVANEEDGTVSRIDPYTNRVAQTIEVGNSPAGITVAAGRVWVTVQRSATAAFAILAKGGMACGNPIGREPLQPRSG